MDEKHVRVWVPVSDVFEGDTGTADRAAGKADIIDTPGVGAVVIQVVKIGWAGGVGIGVGASFSSQNPQ